MKLLINVILIHLKSRILIKDANVIAIIKLNFKLPPNP